jgi:transposase-like protein
MGGMSARQRNSVARSPSSESQMTYSRFLELYPDNDACLEYLKDKFFPDGSECPDCGRVTKFHRIKSRAAYSCQYCRYQAYPTAGTIFHKSTVSLQLWFFAIYLMSSTRCGLSAKQLEREIGVTYKTAHRMFKQIRTLLSDDSEAPLMGNVEVDETSYGGKARAYESGPRRPTDRLCWAWSSVADESGRGSFPTVARGRFTQGSWHTFYRRRCSSRTSGTPTKPSRRTSVGTDGSST